MKNIFKSERPTSQALAAYLADEVTASEAAQIETELAASSHARRRLQQLHDIQNLLSAVDPACAQVDLAPSIRQALAEPPEQPKQLPGSHLWSAFAGLGWVAVAAPLDAREQSAAKPEFRPKAIEEEGYFW